jgi:hypothetical protein
MSERPESIRQLGTHRKLVSQTEQWEPDARLALDAIVVPAARPVWNLEQAITLARAIHCTLLILCSREVKPAEVHQLLAERSFTDAIVVNLPDRYRHELLNFRGLASIKDYLPEACSYYVTDLSTKRNVGLILARMLGWRRIFFLDDDIRDIAAADVHSTVSMLGSYPIAGMRVTDYPDNSAACHAHRITGGLQDVFITGAALAVDCQQNIGFFANIYNEDWLFFLNAAARGRLGSSGRTVTQLRYDPFADPKRAAWQEFGDVLAEGLYALLDHDMGVEYATSEYWHYFLAARRRFLETIIRRSGTADPGIRERLLLSVEAALKCSITIEPELLEHYVWLWRRDLRDWEGRVVGIGQVPSIEVALKELELEPSDGRVAGVACYRSIAAIEATSPVPSAAPDYRALVAPRANDAGSMAPGWGKRGEFNRRARSLVHRFHAVRESWTLALARRFFRAPEREYAPMESSPAPDAQPVEPAMSYGVGS